MVIKTNIYDYRVVTLSKLYLAVTGIIMSSLKSVGQFLKSKKTTNAFCDGRPDKPSLIMVKHYKIMIGWFQLAEFKFFNQQLKFL